MADLPVDIAEVWFDDPDGTAAFLILAWDEERFRRSAAHLLAVEEHRHVLAKREMANTFRKRDLKAIAGGKTDD